MGGRGIKIRSVWFCVCVHVGGGEGVGVRIHTKLRTTDQPHLAHYSYIICTLMFFKDFDKFISCSDT